MRVRAAQLPRAASQTGGAMNAARWNKAQHFLKATQRLAKAAGCGAPMLCALRRCGETWRLNAPQHLLTEAANCLH